MFASMSHVSRNRAYLLAGAACGALAAVSIAEAADLKMPVKAAYAQPLFDWTGFYIGGHTGYSHGRSSSVLWDPAPTTQSGNFSGVIGGLQGGYNWRHASGLLVGVETDMTFPNYLASNSIASRIATPRNDFVEQWDYVGTLRGRIRKA